jgi:hypothetical protein
MSESTRIMILLILGLIVLFIASLYGQSLMMKQSLRAVIKSFRDNQALTPESAKLPNDLGFKRRGLLQIRGFRDYKPTAIQFLQKQDIIRGTEDGRIYISEETLYQSGIENRIGRQK